MLPSNLLSPIVYVSHRCNHVDIDTGEILGTSVWLYREEPQFNASVLLGINRWANPHYKDGEFYRVTVDRRGNTTTFTHWQYAIFTN